MISSFWFYGVLRWPSTRYTFLDLWSLGDFQKPEPAWICKIPDCLDRHGESMHNLQPFLPIPQLSHNLFICEEQLSAETNQCNTGSEKSSCGSLFFFLRPVAAMPHKALAAELESCRFFFQNPRFKFCRHIFAGPPSNPLTVEPILGLYTDLVGWICESLRAGWMSCWLMIQWWISDEW